MLRQLVVQKLQNVTTLTALAKTVTVVAIVLALVASKVFRSKAPASVMLELFYGANRVSALCYSDTHVL